MDRELKAQLASMQRTANWINGKKIEEPDDDLIGFEEFKLDKKISEESEYISAKAILEDKLTQLKPTPIPNTASSIVENITANPTVSTLSALALTTQRFSSLIKDKATISPVEKLQHLLYAV